MNMERSFDTTEPSESRYSNELSPAKSSFIDLANGLLEHCNPDIPITFVDIVARADPETAYQRLLETRVGGLLLKPGDQMAIESDGSYYPILDLPKPEGAPRSIGVTVWGRGHVWEGTRKIDIQTGYDVGGTDVGETVSLSISSTPGGHQYASRNVSLMEYAETGYEGHHFTGTHDLSEEDVEEFIELVNFMVGDEPLSVGELQAKRFEVYMGRITREDSRAYVEEWVDNSLVGQVLADLGSEELHVDDVPLGLALMKPELADRAHETLVNHVNYLRHERNENTSRLSENHFVSKYATPWRDGPGREE